VRLAHDVPPLGYPVSEAGRCTAARGDRMAKPLGPQNDLDEYGDPKDPNWSKRLTSDMQRQRTRVPPLAPSEVRRHREKKKKH
jgi:hypothetical protein